MGKRARPRRARTPLVGTSQEERAAYGLHCNVQRALRRHITREHAEEVGRGAEEEAVRAGATADDAAALRDDVAKKKLKAIQADGDRRDRRSRVIYGSKARKVEVQEAEAAAANVSLAATLLVRVHDLEAQLGELELGGTPLHRTQLEQRTTLRRHLAAAQKRYEVERVRELGVNERIRRADEEHARDPVYAAMQRLVECQRAKEEAAAEAAAAAVDEGASAVTATSDATAQRAPKRRPSRKGGMFTVVRNATYTTTSGAAAIREEDALAFGCGESKVERRARETGEDLLMADVATAVLRRKAGMRINSILFADAFFCPSCGRPFKQDVGSILFCKPCHITVTRSMFNMNMEAEIPKSSAKRRTQIYLPVGHVVTRIREIEGMIRAYFTEKVWRDISREFYDAGVHNLCDGTAAHLFELMGVRETRTAMKRSGNNKKYDHTQLVRIILSGMRPPRIPTVLRNEVVLMARMIIPPYLQIMRMIDENKKLIAEKSGKPFVPRRRNTLNNHYMLLRLFELRGHGYLRDQMSPIHNKRNTNQKNKIIEILFPMLGWQVCMQPITYTDRMDEYMAAEAERLLMADEDADAPARRKGQTPPATAVWTPPQPPKTAGGKRRRHTVSFAT